MDLSDIDKMIAEREGRIDKRKADGTLFEEEFAKNKTDNEDQRLADEVQKQKDQMADKMKEALPACPQCGVKMTYIPEQSIVACQTCGIGMRV